MSLNSCLIGLDQLYTGRADEVLGERVLIIYFRNFHSVLGSVLTLWPCALKVLSSIMGSPCFSFSHLFFFLFSFFLVIAGLFCFLK